MPDTPDLESFRRHYDLAEKLVAQSTKAEIAEVARLLAINCAHYQSKYGEQLLDETTDVASADKPTREMAKLLNSGMQTLCGVIAIVIGDAPPDGLAH